MADMSKAEKLAAARKKLRQFQSNRENIPSPSSDVKQSAKSPTPTSSPIPSKNGIEPKPPDLGNDLQTHANDDTNNNRDSLQLQMNNLHISDIPSQHFLSSEQAAQADTDNLSSPTPNNFMPQNEVQHFLSPEDLYHQTTSRSNVTENFSTSTPIFTPQQQSDTQTGEEGLTLESIQSTSESLFQLAMQMNGLISTGADMNATGSPTIVTEDSSMLGSSKDTDLLARNQRLASELSEKQQALDQLKASFEQLQNQAKEREEELQRALTGSEQKWMGEAAALREQLQLHTQTVGILVAEKTEAQAALSRTQLAAKSKAAEAEEAQGRLRASRQRLSEMESALNSLKSGKEQESVHAQETTAELERLRRQLQTNSTQLQDVKEENSQLQQRVQLSAQQITSLQAELAEKQSQLSITQVHLQQLGGSVPDGKMVSEAQAELQAEHERRTALEKELAELRNAMAERDQSSHQYQQFIQQLNSQLTSIATKLQETSQENTALSQRNNSLVKHLAELESRMQKGSALTPQQVEEQEKLALQVKTLADGKAVLEIKLSGEEAKVAELQSELSQLQEKVSELQEGRPDDVKLLAAMESDKVAAARATAQNTQLKQQLLESQFVHAQLTDRIRHFEAQAFETETLQRKLFDAQAQLEAVMAENTQLKSMPAQKSEEPAKEASDESSLTAEAAVRLQERFTDTMHRLAEISDEKQRLEHLVMQLQGETETIGEYVALYQQQRGMLQQRAAEKDLEVARMAADREQMRQKLQRVGHLVSVLVSETPLTNQEASKEDAPVKNGLGSDEVAKQIAELLSEIGDSETLAEPSPHTTPLLHSAASHTKDTMLPCALCSGRLKVV
ncbi:hypothetical protein B566_EDAN016630 [Ephemera danica]|nr:hypothetical protein B566_EDAN016630 [Ephemera danica]